ncbi:hypothetical protein [Clostridium transplantifaecale]|uniref:hypothetical protein n=1 Tax=Clostridium transplantifaecale TaxID=2479838 RepID=UPI000F6343C1|nr:hypothetical protein [Clostridium transplantifaecale]
MQIRNDVWRRYGIRIMERVKAGNGDIVATSAIVAKDMELYSIAGGMLAKHIKYRFDEKNAISC